MARRTQNFSQLTLIEIASRLKELMFDGESMNAFCRRMGNIDSGNMSRYMSAKVVPTLDTLISIADAANVTLDWLAIGVGPKFRSEIGKAVSIASLYK